MNIVMFFFFQTNLHITKGWNSTYSQQLHLFFKETSLPKEEKTFIYTTYALGLAYIKICRHTKMTGALWVHFKTNKKNNVSQTRVWLYAYTIAVLQMHWGGSAHLVLTTGRRACAQNSPRAHKYGTRLHHLTVLLKSRRNVHTKLTKLKLPDHWNSKAQLWQIGGLLVLECGNRVAYNRWISIFHSKTKKRYDVTVASSHSKIMLKKWPWRLGGPTFQVILLEWQTAV